MVYKSYKYGCRKKEIKKLINKHVDLKKKERYHQNMVKNINTQISDIEEELDKYL
jgi:hypothetical protein